MKPNRVVCLLMAGLWACTPKIQVTNMELPSGTSVMPVVPTDDAGGMYYALPLSLITVDVPVTKIERSKGDCFDEADSMSVKLLRERVGKATADELTKKWKDTANKGTYTFYKLDKEEIAISTRPAPDPAKVYYATLKNRWNKNQQLTLNLNELGQMTKGEFVNEDRTFDLIVQGVSSIAGIISAVLPAKSSTTGNTAAIVAAATDPTTMEWQLEHYADAGRACFEQKKNLLTTRKVRFDLNTTTSSSGDATIYKRKLDDLNALEAGILAGLTYEEKKTKVVLHMDILVPAPATSTPADLATVLAKIPLFAFDKAAGIEILVPLASGSYQNEYLLPIGRQVPTATGGFDVYYLAFDYARGNQVADRTYVSAGGSTTKPGIAYNIPVWVRGRVETTGKPPVAVAMLPMPQLGQVAYLPQRVSKVGFDLDPLTGALRTISLQQTGLTADQIKAAGDAATSGITAVKKPAAKTDLETIQGDNALLEQQIKKINQQNKLDSLLGRQSRGDQ